MRRKGRVQWFNENKGYGCIRQESDGQNIYVHYSDIEGEGFRTLNEGETVEYDLAQGPKRLRAIRVRKL